MDIVENLRAERVKLAERLVELDQIQTERASVIAQVAQIDKAIAVLTKQAGAPGTRKPMSEEGKAAIKAGLEKARAAKLVGTTGTAQPVPATPPNPAAVSPVPESPAAGKKAAASDKGASRGN